MCDAPNMAWQELEAKLGKILSEKSNYSFLIFL